MAAKKAGDTEAIPILQDILAEERDMAEWLLHNLPDVTEQFILRSEAEGVEAKK